MKKSAAESPPLSPTAIAKMAIAMSWKENARIDIFPYESAILALRERGYSYGEIATWLSEKLNAPVQRGQVYYVCQARAEEAQEQEVVHLVETSGPRGLVYFVAICTGLRRNEVKQLRWADLALDDAIPIPPVYCCSPKSRNSARRYLLQ